MLDICVRGVMDVVFYLCIVRNCVACARAWEV